MQKLENFALGQWFAGDGEPIPQFNAYTGEVIFTANSDGLDYRKMFDFARKTGGFALRKMTFHERGRMLKALALFLMDRKAHYYAVSHLTGATRADSWVDIEGGIGNLFANASLRRRLPDEPFCLDGEQVKSSENGTFIGQHILVSKKGVAVHINAFNFPIWGMLEKIAVNFLAGVPAIVKASEQTSFLTEAIVRDIILSEILPAGALQLVVGSGRGILDPVTEQDVVTFTGSAATGQKLRAHPAILRHSVPFNMEADSLNAAILAPDAAPGTPEFDIFIKEIRREMTLKAGQRCTGVRRILVPEKMLFEVQKAIQKAISQNKMGDPSIEGVRMGALINQKQVARVLENLKKLESKTTRIMGDPDAFEVFGANRASGAFLPPILLLNERPKVIKISHEIECFGPVSTLMPYKTIEDAIEIANLGKGSLVSTIATFDQKTMREYLLEAGAFHGRILLLNRNSAKESTGHGSPLALLTHGGPGRAGGGEEMGGLRGVKHYMQRVAVQGHPTDISAATNFFQIGAARPETEKHPFKKYFEELEIGETLTTAKHTIHEADIVNFANVSGDNFYAHMDATSLADSPFAGRVAHGYYILSKAAGLFVEAKKGPVLLNYGLEECRFVKPVYPGSTIGVKLTVREKIPQEVNPDAPEFLENGAQNIARISRGIVKWLVDVTDETGESVAVATILTMVRMR
jgi:oxepin-CoA hydrolase / 3-oxo-5,6-dehydrosuberyl-CoA semialdehyde dehydrogenase